MINMIVRFEVFNDRLYWTIRSFTIINMIVYQNQHDCLPWLTRSRKVYYFTMRLSILIIYLNDCVVKVNDCVYGSNDRLNYIIRSFISEAFSQLFIVYYPIV